MDGWYFSSLLTQGVFTLHTSYTDFIGCRRSHGHSERAQCIDVTKKNEMSIGSH